MEDLSVAIEELQHDFDEKCDELAEVRAELRRARIEAQQLRLRLQAAGVKNTSVVPDKIQAGPGAGNSQAAELHRLLEWIAEHVQLDHPAILDAGCDVVMDGRHVRLGRVKQWRLDFPGDLKLSVPLDLSEEIGGLLTTAKLCNNTVDKQKSQSIADEWDLVVSEVADDQSPVVLLVHRQTSAGILVATWPSAPVRPRPRSSHGVKNCRPSSCPPQLGGASWGSQASIGDRVQVQYEGEWFTGTLWNVEDGSIAHVQCDVDPPEVMTVVSVSMLRLLQRGQPPFHKPSQGIA